MKLRETTPTKRHVNLRDKSKPTDKLEKFGGISFKEQVGLNLKKNTATELNLLLAEVDECGNNFEKKLTLESLVKYKNAVSKFLDHAVNSMFEFKKYDFLIDGGGRDMFAVVRKVNTKLEEITSEFLLKQNDRIEVLNVIDEIRGILLDVIL